MLERTDSSASDAASDSEGPGEHEPARGLTEHLKSDRRACHVASMMYDIMACRWEALDARCDECASGAEPGLRLKSFSQPMKRALITVRWPGNQ